MKKIISLLVLSTLLLVSCSKAQELEPVQEQVEKTKVVEEQKKEEVVVEEPVEEVIEVVPIFERRPIAVMLDNHWDARPQMGFSEAKIIYEMQVEGTITRMMMLSDATEGSIGPVRSARPYFVRAMQEWGSLYAHVGGSAEAISMLAGEGLQDMDQFFVGSDAYRRESHREMPHNMYADRKKLYEVAKNRGYITEYSKDFDYPLMRYSKEVKLEKGEKKNKVSFTYSPEGLSEPYRYDLSFVYDEITKTYDKRYSDVVLVDERNDEPVRAKNVILQIAVQYPHADGSHVIIETVGEGKGYYMTDGKVVEITWKKESEYAPTNFFIGEEPLVLNPGLTFINVVREDMELNFE